MIRTTRIESIEQWEAVRQSFDDLAGDYFTRRFAWLSAWWDAFRNDQRQLYILAVHNDETPIAFLPLYLSNNAPAGRELALLGSGKACSDNMQLFVQPGYEIEAAESIVDYLFQSGLSGQWNRLVLEGVRVETIAMQRLLLRLRTHLDQSLYEIKNESCWEVPLAATWPEFIAAQSKQKRQFFNRMDREYFNEGRIAVSVAADQLSVAEQFVAITELHQARRRSKSADGCLDTIGFEAFLREASLRLCESGEWCSMLIAIDGQPAAGFLGAKSATRISTYLSGMNPNLEEHRPGLLLNMAAMKYAIETGRSKLDFMRGDEVYKSRLGANASSQYTWIASAPRFIPRLRNGLTNASRSLKHWLKSQTVSSSLK